MLKVVSLKICPFVQRVTAALEAKNIAYEVEYIDFDNPPEWFEELSPNRQLPLLITDSGTTLFESDANVEYIDDISDPLNADLTAEQRAIERARSYQATKYYLVQCGAMQSSDKDTLAERSKNLGCAFGRIESALGDGPYFTGESLGNVDIAWLPLLHRAAIIEDRTGYDFLAEYLKTKTWQSTLMKTGLAEKSVATDFIEAFSNFYLSDRTYLGRGEDCPVSAGSSYCSAAGSSCG